MLQAKFDRVAPFGVSRESFEKLERLEALAEKWQSHINLVSNSTLPDFWNRHIVDSAQILPLIPSSTRAIADLGSGGGFPGLVIAACQPADVHFYEANAKKTAFLQEALRHMNCSGMVNRLRLEPFRMPHSLPEFQIVTARAFAPLPLLLKLAEPFIRGGAKALFHKGQEYQAEIAEAARTFKLSYVAHPSATDSQSVILEIKEIAHV
ncbi:MAG: 16S rRNA (guanine(527)-N(7))-methyltransferase RsmG [Alphaproteobacteria bacterium]|nr:16S rRNA (guanine(527)-N(7))-methyltransferase RsmG [Alphaproteobacteria bacterium]